MIPGLGRSPGGEHGNPSQYSCLENPVDRGVWQVTVHGVAKGWTQLKWLSIHAHRDSKHLLENLTFSKKDPVYVLMFMLDKLKNVQWSKWSTYFIMSVSQLAKCKAFLSGLTSACTFTAFIFTLFRLFLSQLLYFIQYYRCLCWFNFLNRYDIEENMSIMKQLELFFSLGLPTPFLPFLLFFFPVPKFLQNSYSICRITCYWRDPNNSLFKIIKAVLKM